MNQNTTNSRGTLALHFIMSIRRRLEPQTPILSFSSAEAGRTARWCESGGGEACGLVPGPDRTSRHKQTADPDLPKLLPAVAITIAGRATRDHKQESIDCSPDFE
ncbi:unnamed protein product [Natator depressus]